MFELGDKVICIEKPEKHAYQCGVGQVFVVKNFNPGKTTFTPDDDILGYTRRWFLCKNFELLTESQGNLKTLGIPNGKHS